jgi:hypothetical protein
MIFSENRFLPDHAHFSRKIMSAQAPPDCTTPE